MSIYFVILICTRLCSKDIDILNVHIIWLLQQFLSALLTLLSWRTYSENHDENSSLITTLRVFHFCGWNISFSRHFDEAKDQMTFLPMQFSSRSSRGCSSLLNHLSVASSTCKFLWAQVFTASYVHKKMWKYVGNYIEEKRLA